MKISIGASCHAKKWKNQDWPWEKLTAKLSKPVRTYETVQEYRKMSHDKQSQIKDIGGFVGGELKDGKRSRLTVLSRSLVTLDADYADPGFWEMATILFDCRMAVYSTHKHTTDNPRLRLVIPLSRPVGPEEYEAIARKIADSIGLDQFDDTTYQASRLMYWPSCSKDGDWLYEEQDGDDLDPDTILAEYDDWTDVEEWPISSREQAKRKTIASKQADPLSKPGIVGAFCRTYSIRDAIAKFLPDVYEESDDGKRYSFIGGSGANGLVVYDEEGLCYSNHSTDPAGGQCCNAFDLVRIHLFGAEDEDKTKTGKEAASYKRMCEFATSDGPVKVQLAKEMSERSASDFDDLDLEEFAADQREDPDNQEPDDSWIEKLDVNKNGTFTASRLNVLRILQNDPKLKGAIAYDELAQVEVATRDLPWRKIKNKAERYLRDSDDASLRIYLERNYKGTDSPQKAHDAVMEVSVKNSFHPVREYLKGLVWDGEPRIDGLLSEYFEIENDPGYVAAVTRKTLVAAVARVFQPGIKYEQVLTLKGGQGIGKSSLFARLGGEWFSDSIGSLNGDKTAMESLQGVWIMELGELDAVKKSESSAVKAFISKTDDFYRSAYARRKEIRPRQLIFVATTNEGNFLRDETGGRRWWIVDVEGKPDANVWDSLTDEKVGQIWAEAVHFYNQGEVFWKLTPEHEAIAKDLQESHKEDAPKKGIITDYLELLLPEDWDDRTLEERRVFVHGSDYADPETGTKRRERVCAAEIWCELYRKELADMRRIDAKEINDILAQIPGWEKAKTPRKFSGPYGNQRGYIRAAEQSTSYKTTLTGK